MPQFKFELFGLQLNKGGFTKTLDQDMKVQIRQAARAFARVAAELVPVRTGFARGVFRNITEDVGGRSSQVFSALRVVGRTRFKEYYRGVLKTNQSGRQFATQPGNIFTANGFRYTFNFNVEIDYFNINDFFSNRRTPSAPWRAFEKGAEAFNNYLRTTGISRLPKVSDFLVVSKIRSNI